MGKVIRTYLIRATVREPEGDEEPAPFEPWTLDEVSGLVKWALDSNILGNAKGEGEVTDELVATLQTVHVSSEIV